MDSGETMIVAGIGLRRNAEAHEIVALVEAALQRAALPPGSLTRIATLVSLVDHPAVQVASGTLGIPAVAVGDDALAAAAPAMRTVSEKSLAAHGIGSVAEAAALGGAGPGASLLLERIASAAVTCALARSRTAP
jgi:cobalt-precorrin 5A hydrolase